MTTLITKTVITINNNYKDRKLMAMITAVKLPAERGVFQRKWGWAGSVFFFLIPCRGGQASSEQNVTKRELTQNCFSLFQVVITNCLSCHTRLFVSGDRHFSSDGVQAGDPGDRVNGNTQAKDEDIYLSSFPFLQEQQKLTVLPEFNCQDIGQLQSSS